MSMSMSESDLRQKMLDEIMAAKKGGVKPTTPPPPKPEVEPPKPVIKTKTKGLVELGYIIGTGSKVLVRPPFKDEDWPEEVRWKIPAKNECFVENPGSERLYISINHGLKTMAVGMPGTGKDESFRQYCAHFRVPYFRITGMRNVTPDMIIGHFSMEDGSMKWIPGDAETVCRYGGMLVISEPAAMPPDTLFCLQSAWEQPGYLTILDHPDPRDRMLQLNPNTFFVMTSNVRGFGDNTDKYAATNVMDASFLNRVESMLYMPPMDSKDEVFALGRYVEGIDSSIMEKMVKFGNLIRAGWDKNEIEPSWSIRNLIAWGKMLVVTGDISTSFKNTFWDKLNDVEKGAVRRFWSDVGFRESL